MDIPSEYKERYKQAILEFWAVLLAAIERGDYNLTGLTGRWWPTLKTLGLDIDELVDAIAMIQNGIPVAAVVYCWLSGYARGLDDLMTEQIIPINTDTPELVPAWLKEAMSPPEPDTPEHHNAVDL